MKTNKRITQLSVFLENRSGRIGTIASVLGQAGVDLRALSLADSSDFGILRLIVDDNEKAVAALKEKGFIVKRNEVLAVQMPDEAGSLARTLEAIEGQGLNIEYLYAIIQKPGEYAVLIFRFDDVDHAIACLEAANIRLLDDADLAEK
ncbi:MAG: amino acid-binding protein [Thermodesulfobacteriota bacterium]